MADDGEHGRAPMVWVRNVGAVVALLGGALALVFVLWPDAAPTATPARGDGRAVLSDQRLDPNIARSQYFQRTDQNALGFTQAQLAERGAYLRYRVELEDLRGREISLKRELIDADSGDQVSEERAITITPPKDQTARDWHDWVQLPAGRGRFYIVVQLLAEGEDAPLATLETEPFPGLDGASQPARQGS